MLGSCLLGLLITGRAAARPRFLLAGIDYDASLDMWDVATERELRTLAGLTSHALQPGRALAAFGWIPWPKRFFSFPSEQFSRLRVAIPSRGLCHAMTPCPASGGPRPGALGSAPRAESRAQPF